MALQVVIVTGLSGSGKSTAIRVLEDLGFYCIDNLPVVLTPKFIELCQNSDEQISRVALGIDLRERAFLGDYPAVLSTTSGAPATRSISSISTPPTTSWSAASAKRAGHIRWPRGPTSRPVSGASARSSPG